MIFKNMSRMPKTFPGADTDTDHNLLVVDVQTRLKHVGKRQQMRKWDVEKLKNESTQKEYAHNVYNKLYKLRQNKVMTKEWDAIRNTILKVLEEEVGEMTEKRIKKEWITESMLDKMDKFRKWKYVSSVDGRRQYRKLNNELQRLTNQARENWIQKQNK
ncbi:hypothetical protein J437_LFUL007823 [Ladona fulva]|uniref:Endonuclease-reverse transcriptase n=1 Tax=Ladona fulva TaxID=123851 RepID=A0A8K0P0R0_LADFU|nr:hypothetical protein J437_LFUL007823 [Ladona fulva]